MVDVHVYALATIATIATYSALWGVLAGPLFSQTWSGRRDLHLNYFPKKWVKCTPCIVDVDGHYLKVSMANFHVCKMKI